MAKSKPVIKVPPYQEIFESLGVIFTNSIGDNRTSLCPFCSHEANKFSLNIITGQWVCANKNHGCGRTGNFPSFLSQYYEQILKETTDYEYYALAKYRQLPVSIFQYCGVACKDDEYILPVKNAFGGITDLRRYQIGKKFYSLPEGKLTTPLGIKELINPNRGTEKIWLCGGEFKWMALVWLFKILKLPGIPICTFGETIKNDWLHYFPNREVVTCFDNDKAGNDGINQVAKKLGEQLRGYEYIGWPTDFPSGYDIDAFISAYGVTTEKPKDCWEKLQRLIFPYKDKNLVQLEASRLVIEAEQELSSEIEGDLTIDDVIKEYAQIIDLNDDLIQIIKICFATVLSNHLESKKNPIWIFLVGPPGFGKTEIILSFKEAKNLCFYQSSLKRTSLISGYNQGGMDSSIIPKLNGKTLMLKDYTEILDANPQDQKDIYSVLRGGFDGEIEKQFGNGPLRKYYSSWSTVAGVTRAIQKHSQASVGERFLRYAMETKDIDWKKQQDKALESDLYGGSERTRLFAVVKKYLSQKFDFSQERLKAITIPEYKQKVNVLARFAALLQTPVERHQYGAQQGQTIYDPQQIAGNRLNIQLNKLALCTAIVEGKNEIDQTTYNLVKKVAFDTVYGYHVKILNHMMVNGSSVTVPQLAGDLQLSQAGVKYHLEDMMLLGLIQPGTIIKVGTKHTQTYNNRQEIKELWAQI